MTDIAYRSRLRGAALNAGLADWQGKSDRELLEYLAAQGKLMDFWVVFPNYFSEQLFVELVATPEQREVLEGRMNHKRRLREAVK